MTSASGLVELSQLETDPTRGQRYRAAAANLLDSLASPTYLSSTAASAGLLLHGSRNYPGDIRTYVFGHYYFLEALLRYWRLPAARRTWSLLGFARYPASIGNAIARPHSLYSIAGIEPYIWASCVRVCGSCRPSAGSMEVRRLT